MINKLAMTLLTTVALLALVSSCGDRPKGVLVTPAYGLFRISVDSVGKGEVKFFRYNFGGKDIVFFVARTADGAVKTAFNACRTCFPHHMGYRQEGDKVVCAYCGMSFPINELSEGQGNCVPVKINSRVEGGYVVVDQREIEAGAEWF